jgi:hypothetical protein
VRAKRLLAIWNGWNARMGLSMRRGGMDYKGNSKRGRGDLGAIWTYMACVGVAAF